MDEPSNSQTAMRGAFAEIICLIGKEGVRTLPSTIIELYKDALPERFAAFDNEMRGDALNLDLYGVSADHQCAVVQIRHAFRRYKDGYLNVHKSYVLVGLNEDTGETFRHPVSSSAVRNAVRADPSNPVAAVRGAQRWMWQVNDAQLDAGRRQGDILLVPAKGRPSGASDIMQSVVTVGGSHEIAARRFCETGRGIVYAEAPTIRHTKRQHEALYADGDGWYSVRVGREVDTWAWGSRLGD